MNFSHVAKVSICFLLMIGIPAGSTHHSQQSVPSMPSYYDLNLMAHGILTLPRWPTEGDFTQEQVRDYARAAYEFQMLGPASQIALLAHVDCLSLCLLSDEATGPVRFTNPQMNVMLLLRFAFDVPAHEKPKGSGAAGMVAGGFNVKPRAGATAAAQSAASPLEFKGTDVRLVAYDGMGGGSGGPPYHRSLEELLHFRETFGIRRELSELAAYHEILTDDRTFAEGGFLAVRGIKAKQKHSK